MIYCPHCNRPSARKDGPCPHCKGDLSGKKVPKKPAEGAKPAPKATPASGSGIEVGADASESTIGGASGLELDSGYTSEGDAASATSGLSLQSIAPPPGARAEAEGVEKKTDEMAVKDASGYGRAGAGIVGGVKYWLRVRKRQVELEASILEAEKEVNKGASTARDVCAVLGKKAHEAGIQDKKLKPLMSAALLAQGELEGTRRKRESMVNEHQGTLAPLEAQLKTVEAEAVPLRQNEAVAVEAQTKQAGVVKGVQVQLKRVEIELRNIEGIMEKKRAEQQKENLPEADKAKLETDISALEARKPPLLEQVQTLRGELETASAPMAELDARLTEAKSQMADKQARIDNLKSEVKRLANQFLSAQGNVSREVEGESGKVEGAWAAVGETVVRLKINNPAFGDDFKKAGVAMVSEQEKKNRLELLRLAIDSYDSGVVESAKKTVLLAGVVAAAIVLTLIIVAVV